MVATDVPQDCSWAVLTRLRRRRVVGGGEMLSKIDAPEDLRVGIRVRMKN